MSLSQKRQAGAQDKVEIDLEVTTPAFVPGDVVSWVDDAGRIVEWKITKQIFR